MINGMWIYLYSVVEGIKTFLVVVSVFGLIATLISMSIMSAMYEDGELEKERFTKSFRRTFVIFILCLIMLFISCIIPSQETLITMKVFDLATKENINWTIEQAKSIIDYLVESIAKIVK